MALASRGITVNAVAPGIIDTEMSEQASTLPRSSNCCRCSAPAVSTRWRRWWASCTWTTRRISRGRCCRSTALCISR
ncbi:hypothetical protein QU481_02350 [Crenobacter sp. SG2303]|uniref:SDR family oxidoreductase n=1 Tax=Crenobacter oryzisoli TaxID=3056844 RepID=A0ABT7XIX5_9NEIS|nr:MULTISPECIES: hypothetical protein [unclassified Crenobacter]MDN0073735.1 hypothetical protein [Crenobacter sp. SG2303]MDN0082719.1 hypothetical protein [Crenobacter sp. SG2305]